MSRRGRLGDVDDTERERLLWGGNARAWVAVWGSSGDAKLMEVVRSSGWLQARERQRQLLCGPHMLLLTHPPGPRPAELLRAKVRRSSVHGASLYSVVGCGLVCALPASTRQLEVGYRQAVPNSQSSAGPTTSCIRGPSFWRRAQVPVPSMPGWSGCLSQPAPCRHGIGSSYKTRASLDGSFETSAI